MTSDFELINIWHHIEDQVKPSKSQMVRQVMDVHIKGNVIDFNFDSIETNEIFNDLLDKFSEQKECDDIFGIQVLGRNISEELAFSIEDRRMKVYISNYNWPKAQSKSPFKKHVKFELRYLESCPAIKSHTRGYKSSFCLWWTTRPEYTITTPSGMQMKNDNSLRLSCMMTAILPDGELKTRNFKNLNLKKPDVTVKEGKHVYTYVINDKDYTTIYQDDIDIIEISFVGEYEVSYKKRFWGFVGFAGLLLFYSFYELLKITVDLPFLVALLSFTFIYIEYDRYNHPLPLENVVGISIVISWLLLFFVIIYLFTGTVDHIIRFFSNSTNITQMLGTIILH